MAVPKLVELVARLYRKTKQNKINWEKTIEEDVFQTNFPGFSVRLFPKDGDMYLQIYNDEGLLIDQVIDTEIRGESIEGEGPFGAMTNMHALARRNALGVDKVLDSLLEELGD